MKLSKITRKQVEQVLKDNPIHEVLNIDKSALTPKQLKYCENVARGETKAMAYRKAYNSKAKPQIQANEGYKLSKRPDIDAMTEAIRRGLEWEKSYSLAQTRALVVERLTKEALDEDSSPSARINALKALGTVAGVDAFVHRTETTVIKDSTKIRDELLSQLKQAMESSTIDLDADEQALLAEINPPASSNGDMADPPEGDHPFLENHGTPVLHINPDTQSPKNTKSENTPKNPEQNHGVPEHLATLPHANDSEEGVGASKNDANWKESDIGKAPPSGFKTKG